MGFWNAALAAGWRRIFYPSVGTALNWLHVVCPACHQMGETDLRKIDIHPNASLDTVVREMSCRRCSPHPPFARPLGATRRSWYGNDGWLCDPYRASLVRVEHVETEDIGGGQRQVAATKRKRSHPCLSLIRERQVSASELQHYCFVPVVVFVPSVVGAPPRRASRRW
jgi:hypothetical protein